MEEKSLEPKLYGKVPSKNPEPLCDGKIVISRKDGWRYFNCEEIGCEDGKGVNKIIAIKDYGVNNRERETKLKNIIRRVLCPQYRCSCQIG